MLTEARKADAGGIEIRSGGFRTYTVDVNSKFARGIDILLFPLPVARDTYSMHFDMYDISPSCRHGLNVP